MNLINGKALDLGLLREALKKPKLYEKSTHSFWEDEVISAQMLQHHLDPDQDAASRRRETIRTEADFIMARTGMNPGSRVLDLGCGPGLYIEEFERSGAVITGIDMAASSIQYA